MADATAAPALASGGTGNEAEFTRQRDAMRTLLRRTGNQAGWDDAWQRGLTPWEGMLGNVAQPSLRWLVEQRPAGAPDIVAATTARRRALVPGCGRGHDVLYLARHGLDAVGVDISQTAVQAARTWLAAQHDQHQDEALARRAQVVQADYLAEPSAASLSGFDLVYDYTFFCAIPPSLHAAWAAAHANALVAGGLLVCLVYPLKSDGSPITSDEAQVGPPFPVSTEMVSALLAESFQLVFHGTAPDLPAHKVGRETIMVWQKR